VEVGKISAAGTVFLVSAAAVLFAGPAEADRIRNDEWHIRSLRVAQANQISTGKGVVVAVIDSGVYPHVDLRNNLLNGTSVISGGDDNGKSDPDGHGTKMASLIAAHGRPNGAGVVGIAPGAKILPVQFFDAKGGGSSISAGKAIEWATNHGAKVINFSGAVAPSLPLQSGMKIAEGKDVLVVAASGNVGQDVIAAYPAAMPGVLAVGASDKSGQHAAISVSTKQVQICAPGVEIEGAKPPNRYSIGEGTSDSTAIVSGAAALVRAKFPQLSAQEVIHRLTATATDIGPPGRDDECGYGVLNIVKALTADVPPLESSAAPITPPSQPPPTTTTAAAAPPDTKPASSNTPAVIGGVVIVLLVGGLVAFLIARRRRTS
jgi:type VII secretion-associated serine protease mycosin